MAVASVVTIMTSAGCATAASHAGGTVTGGTVTGGRVAGGPAVIVVRDNANGKAVFARAGDRIELILSSSYWHVAGSSAPRVLRQDRSPVLLPRPKTCPAIPGLGCIPVRTDFTALAAGKAEITASRTACGEARPCTPGQSHFTATIVVR